MQYANAEGSTATIWVFQADEVLNDDFVINTFGMSSKTTSTRWQVLTQDTEGYLDYAVTATSNGLVVVVTSQGANSGWLIAGWPTTTSSEPGGPTPYPEPISLSALTNLDATMTRDSLSELSSGTLIRQLAGVPRPRAPASPGAVIRETTGFGIMGGTVAR